MDVYNRPFLSIYQSEAVTPGQAIVNHVEQYVVLNPRDAHAIRRQIEMNEFNAHLIPEPIPARSQNSPHTPRHRQKDKKQPLVARILAGVIVGGLILWGVVSCGAAVARAGVASNCQKQLTQTLQSVGSDRTPTQAEVDACVDAYYKSGEHK